MRNQNWFRRSTWTDADHNDFNTRLSRCRSDSKKAQCLRIQALYLAQAGHHKEAIELLNRLLAEYPDRIEIAQTHAQKAKSFAKLGQDKVAIDEFRLALQFEREFPNVGTNAWLDFGWFVLEKQLSHLYEEVRLVLKEFRREDDLKFPATEYQYAAIQSLLANARGEIMQAREFARNALIEAAKNHSGLRYHPNVGLVANERNTFEDRLKALANY